jgi:hypothetical protein
MAVAPPRIKVVKPSSEAKVVVFDEKLYGIGRLKSLGGVSFQKKRKLEALEDDEPAEMPGTAGRPSSNDPDEYFKR